MTIHELRTPYLLFLGDATDATTAKTATGVAHWRPDACVGELRYPDAKATAGLPAMDVKAAVAAGAQTLVIGVANAGGILHESWVDTLCEALEAGLDLASGLHMRLSSHARLRATAERCGRSLHDVRAVSAALPVGTGMPRSGHRVLTVGTDCSVGKMYTALALERAMRARGIDADFRATGQTGILIAGSGIAVDAVVADFISGAAERLSPAAPAEHWDLIEGQGSLLHPSFAGVSLGLLHGAQPEAMVMCHHPTRRTMRGLAGRPLPDLAHCIGVHEAAAAVTAPGARVIGIALNTSELDEDAARRCIEDTAGATALPCCDPVRTGVDVLVDACLAGSE